MGNGCCKPVEDAEGVAEQPKSLRRPRWKADQPITLEELERMRAQFWDTEPHYGGDRVIWDALKAACEADLDTAKIILDSAGIIIAKSDLSLCYDERGSKYELPKYVLNVPSNLVRSSSKPMTPPPQVELLEAAAR